MPNILIAEGTPAVWQAERAGFGLPSNFSLFAAAVQLHHPDIRCTPLNIADGEALPYGTTLSDFDGVMFPGSPLHIYDSIPGDAADRFRPCRLCSGRAGLGQLLGSAVGRGGAWGIGPAQPAGTRVADRSGDYRDRTGRSPPLLASRPAVFDALCSHLDEVETLPPNSQVLAENEVSAIQAIAAQTSVAGSFHGTQYHPEHTLAVSAALVEMRAAELVEEGLGTNLSEIVAIAADYRALDESPPAAT